MTLRPRVKYEVPKPPPAARRRSVLPKAAVGRGRIIFGHSGPLGVRAPLPYVFAQIADVSPLAPYHHADDSIPAGGTHHLHISPRYHPYLTGGPTVAQAITTMPPSRDTHCRRDPDFVTKFAALRPGSVILLQGPGGIEYGNSVFLKVETIASFDELTGLLHVMCVTNIPDIGWCRLMIEASHRGLERRFNGNLFSYRWSSYRH